MAARLAKHLPDSAYVWSPPRAVVAGKHIPLIMWFFKLHQIYVYTSNRYLL